MLRPGSSFGTKPAASNASVGSNDSSKNKGVQSLNFDRSEKSKKRGVYVEKNLAMLPNCCTGCECHQVTHQKPDRKQILSSLLEILSKKTISTQYSIMSVLERSKRGARVSEITETATQHEDNNNTVIVNVNTAFVSDNRLPIPNVEYKHSRESNLNKKAPIPKFIPEDNHLKASLSNNNATSKEDRNIVFIKSKTDNTDGCSKNNVLLKNGNTIENCSGETKNSNIKKSNTQSSTKLNCASVYENYCNDNTRIKDEHQRSKGTIINDNYNKNIVISETEIKKRCIHDGNEEYGLKNTPRISVTERKLCTKQSYSYKNKNSGIYVLKDVEGTESNSNHSCSESSTESSSRSWLNLISLLLLKRGCDSDTISSLDELEKKEVIKKNQNNNFLEYTKDRNCYPSDRSVNSRFEIETDSFKDITEPLCDQPKLKRHSSSIIQSPSEIINEKEPTYDLPALKRNSSSVIETMSVVMNNEKHGATDFYESSPSEGEEGGDSDEVDNDNDEIPLAEDTEEPEKEKQSDEERANEEEQEEKQIEEHELEEKVSDSMEVSDRKFLSMSSFDDKFFDSEKENVPDEDDDDDEFENDRERLKINMRNALAAQISNYGNTLHQNEMKIYSTNPFERGPSYDDDEDDDFMFIRTSKPVINLNSTSFMTRSTYRFPSAATSERFGKSISDYKNRKFLRSEISYGKFPNSRYQRSEISDAKSRPSFLFNTKYSTNFLGSSPSDFSKRRYTASEYASRIGPILSEATEKSKTKSKTSTKHTHSRPKKNPNRKKVALKKKMLEKQILLKSFKRELKKDLPVYEEPQNLFESLQKMAHNKKLSGKTKKFKYNPETLDIYQDYRTVRFQN